MDYLSGLETADGLDSDGERIYGKGLLQEVKTGSVVPVERVHAEKEQSHTPTLCLVHPKHIRRPKDPPVR